MTSSEADESLSQNPKFGFIHKVPEGPQPKQPRAASRPAAQLVIAEIKVEDDQSQDQSKTPNKTQSTAIPVASATTANVKASRSDVNSTTSSMSEIFQLRVRNPNYKWWFHHPRRGCISTHPTLRGRASPNKLISDGCYRSGTSEHEVLVRCEDPPLGPKTYRFFDTERACVAHEPELSKLNPQRSDVNDSPQISALEPVVELAPIADVTNAQQTNADSANSSSTRGEGTTNGRAWHCLCYQERVDGEPKHATACRPTLAACQELTQKIKVGSSLLVRDSMSAPCQERRGQSPWQTFKRRGSHRSLWRPSSHPGAWWSPAGCFLPGGARSMGAQTRDRARSSSRSSSRSSANARRNRRDKRAARSNSENPPPELDMPIGTSRSLIRFGAQGSAPLAERCAETCRAHLVTKRQRISEYGSSEVPVLLRWGERYATSLEFVKRTCLRVQAKSQRNRRKCVEKVISKCVNYCKRSHH